MEIINLNKKGLIIFIDLAKAFDSLDRKLLRKKIEYLGINGRSLNWFTSYLTGRSQAVSILNQQSSLQSYEYGVIQRNTFAHLLFLMYINNLSKVQITGELFLFADAGQYYSKAILGLKFFILQQQTFQ